MAELLTPHCPLCDEPPVMTLTGNVQAFCGNDDCTILLWNPSLSLDDNLMDAGVVKLPPAEDDSDSPAGLRPPPASRLPRRLLRTGRPGPRLRPAT